MIRQFTNWWHYRRLRTCAPTRRQNKPKLLRQHPELEVAHLIDLVIAQHGGRAEEFFFIQVGAFDGTGGGPCGDPLHALISQYGWHGVLVEPQPAVFEALKQTYANQPQLQLFNVAIGRSDGEATFYTRHDGYAPGASFNKHLLVKPGYPRHKVVAQTVPCWTLETLLRNANAPDHVDLLQIDAEGFDYEIIRTIDFTRLRPSIIRYEHAILAEWDSNACLELLAEQGYRFILEDYDTTAIRRGHLQARAA